MTDKHQATAIVDAIIHDLRGRSGLDNEWDGIDADVQAEIRESWIALAVSAMESPPLSRPWQRTDQQARAEMNEPRTIIGNAATSAEDRLREYRRARDYRPDVPDDPNWEWLLEELDRLSGQIERLNKERQ